MERTLGNSQLFPSVKVPVPPPSLRYCPPRRPSIAPFASEMEMVLHFSVCCKHEVNRKKNEARLKVYI